MGSRCLFLHVCTMVVFQNMLFLLFLATEAFVLTGGRSMWMPDGEGVLHLIDLKITDLKTKILEGRYFFNGEKDVALKLYTQRNPIKAENITIADDSTSPSFNPRHPTRFVIHGWRSSGEKMDGFRKAYMETGLDFNVVIVDWKGRANIPYTLAIINIRRVGKYLAKVIQHLVTNRSLNLDDVYIIGHSLGAHIAAVAGNRLKGQVAQIVGLDAALPLFRIMPMRNRLDFSDAKMVQGIHTNAGLLGWKESLGHIDFFPNGGSHQAGCGLDVFGACSHIRARDFYIESIKSKKFLGTLCHSYDIYVNAYCKNGPKVIMGEWLPKGSTGIYYMKTKSRAPYGLGDTEL